MSREIKYRPDLGAVLLRILNGLKHTPQTVGPLLGVNPEELEQVIKGKIILSSEMETKLISIRGVNRHDFYPAKDQHLFSVIDDTDEGVVICRKEEMIKSRRAIARGPDRAAYYIYGDMAMSRISTFRPEWIRPLFVHDGEEPNTLPDWALNKGHFEHQVTYFIGPVNFHWIDKDGKKHVGQMNTGDTNYIVPFVPHSFTTRIKGEGLILAVTYGGAIADREFGANLSSLSLEEFLGNATDRLPVLSLEAVQGIRGGVIIFRHQEAEVLDLGKTQKGFLSLFTFNCQPQTKVVGLTLQPDNPPVSYNTLSDCWGYLLNDGEVLFRWDEIKRGEEHKCLLKPGDSFFIKPGVAHSFTAGSGSDQAKLLLVDINPRQGDPYAELALIKQYAGEEGLKRAHTETTRWY